MMLALLAVVVAGDAAPGRADALAPPPGRACPGAELQPGPSNGPAIDAAVVCLINHIRAAHNLPALRPNHYLHMIAAAQVGEMVHWNYFADNRPSGLTPLALVSSTRYAANALSFQTGQNIGWATGTDAPPDTMVTAWMYSPPHREIILTRAYEDVGVGELPAVPSVLKHGTEGATYAIEFAARTPGGRL
jgi:uncharacterized protein YkwD